ncbi:hypothetical protein AWENTII_006276 [Aspergillus wentii]
MKRSRPRPDIFTIGWIAALPVELTAAKAVLDEEHEHCHEFSQYTLGRIGFHQVVIAVLPSGQIGTNSAARVAADLKSTFPGLKYGLMVGIGGGAPSHNADIRLGDVVVSQPQGQYGGVVQYDLGKTVTGGLHSRTGFLNAPPAALLTAASQLQSDQSRGRDNVTKHLYAFDHLPNFARCNAGPDILFPSSYNHEGGPTSCDSCRTDMVVSRSPRNESVIYFGTIASGNQVVKDGMTRDRLSADLGGVLCFEMEAAGLMNSLPSLVVRGICDYADSHKNKTWQPVAAAVAAACAKEILSFVPALHVQQFKDTDMQIVVSTESRVKDSAEHRQYFLNQLSFNQIYSRHTTIRAAHVKTCRWLLKRSEYRNWLDPAYLNEHNGFLWIKGKPAAGKSTIMKFLYMETKKNHPDTIITSFFFNARGEELEKSVMGMYRSLLYQLLEAQPDLQPVFDILPQQSSVNDEPHQWDMETIKSLFENAVENLGQRPLLCFVDALDECEEDSIRDMLYFFQQLGERAILSHRQFYVCLSSRHYPHISIDTKIELVLENQEGHQEDITRYIQSEMKAGKSKMAVQIKAEVLERAQGIFLWVVLVVQILNKEYDRGQIHALRKRLKEIPTGLHELLQDILTRDAQNIDHMILCLRWILYATRPLKCEELYFAILSGIESDPEYLTEWSSEETTEDIMERFILNSSKGLAQKTKTKSSTIQFIHESVRDFLLKDNGLDRLQSNLSKNFPGSSHDHLRECCWRHLSIDFSVHLSLPSSLPKANSEDAKTLRQAAVQKFPFLEYAVQNVFYHAETAESHGIPQNSFIERFSFDKWITMNNTLEKYEVRRYTLSASPSYIFSEKGYPSLIRTLRNMGFKMNVIGERHGNPLLAALECGHLDAAKALLVPSTDDIPTTSESFDVNSLHKGSTPLFWALEKGRIEMVKLLLDNGADPNIARMEKSSLYWSIENGHLQIAKLLLEKGASPDVPYASQLAVGVYKQQGSCLRKVQIQMVEIMISKDLYAMQQSKEIWS